MKIIAGIILGICVVAVLRVFAVKIVNAIDESDPF